MSLKHGDKLFVCLDDNALKNKRYSYFGTDFGTITGFWQYIQGYIFAVKALYKEYISCNKNRIDLLDTIIYPLCFNYRQIIELYIKYLYFKYSPGNDSDKADFIKQVSHKLIRAWSKTKPFILPLLSKINSSTDITLFDEFINEVDTFDSDSFRMRYPINKDLSSVHSLPIKLDVIGLHRKMMDLYKLFDELDCEIENVLINNDFNAELIERITHMYSKHKDNLTEVSERLNALAEIEKSNQSQWNISNIEFGSWIDPDRTNLENYIANLSPENAFILGLLVETGRAISNGVYKLAKNNEQNNDFKKIIEITLQHSNSFISLDYKYSNQDMCYSILEKGYIVTSKWLNTSLDLMENCIVDVVNSENMA